MKLTSYFLYSFFLRTIGTFAYASFCFASITSSGSNVPARHICLTESEQQAVAALKYACDEKGVHYKNLFELAKYALVSESAAKDSDPQASQLRLESALKRLQKRNDWIMKHGLQNVDPHKALLELDKECPGFIVNRYSRDKEGRVVVAHHHAFVPTSYVYSSKQNLAKYLAAEQYRLDLGAADMEEARKGIVMASITDGQLTTKRAFRYLKLVKVAQENLKDIHPNDIRQVYSQVPSFLTFMVSSTKKILPKKISERINVVGSIDELNRHLEKSDKEDMTTEDWVQERLQKYEETIRKLTLN